MISRIRKVGSIACLLLVAAAPASQPSVPSIGPTAHVDAAEKLIHSLPSTRNEYAMSHLSLQWPGENGAAASEAHCDCSGFLLLLLEHTYRYTPAQITRWMGHPRAVARDFHDQIVAGHGFDRLTRVADIRRGDVLAVKYIDVPGKKTTGHIMTAAETPEPIVTAGTAGDSEWKLTVIDSALSGHGPTDTRRAADGSSCTGVGEGVIKLFADDHGNVDGYAWSLAPTATREPMKTHHLAVGRLVAGFQP